MLHCPFCKHPVEEPRPAGKPVVCGSCGKLLPSTSAGQAKGVHPNPSFPAEEDDDGEPTFVDRLRNPDGGTLAAFLCGSVALLSASVGPLLWLTKPLGLLGVLLALVAGLLPALKNGKKLDLPLGVLGLCAVVVLFVGRWPSFRGPAPRPTLAVALNPEKTTPIRPLEKGEWVHAGTNAMQMNDLRVEVLGVRVGAVELSSPATIKSATREKYLLIRLRVSYHGLLFREIPYERWADLPGAPSKHPPVLVDDRNRPLAQVAFDPSAKVAGRVEGDALTPGHMVREVLVFPPPPADAQHLRLTLPGSAFGVTGEFRFHIPRGLIEPS
jgi:hypothetical protein